MDKKKLLKKIKYCLRILPDSLYIQIYYFAQFKKFCNLHQPRTYNEKLNWLKIHDRNPEYIKMVDKYEVKKYIAPIIGSEYVVPTLGIWDTFDEIDFDKLPNQFVLKCTHDSEGLVIVKDKNKLDVIAAKKKIEAAQKCNFYYIGREWPYKHLKPRIIAEKYMEDHVDGELRDYKFFCFDGVPKAMFIASDREVGETKFDYFDLDFNQLDIIQNYPNSSKTLRKPITFEKMIELSKVLSKDIPHVRVDFYEVDGKLYFGELTFYHFSGFKPFQPNKWDRAFGDWLKLPK
ncbi:ATP-grasp fold amidoligase family protein [Bacillus sp. AFS055030]|uniref:ATP-grasp fold amidoligase family protein n=1 Tax=Bacillus sp. AFS055030 TaxID=2033507 RepID=UPI000BFD067A|nr:ATP-grasp fold amidoligase family protein [Bacillus sp. AFS055030]PGL72698.1 glycosyl transferase [Bacillus sp. AFS055030]